MLGHKEINRHALVNQSCYCIGIIWAGQNDAALIFCPLDDGLVWFCIGAQNIGAGKRQRANETLRYAVMITVGFGIIVGIFMQFFASPVVALFTDASDASGAEWYVWEVNT